VPPALVPGDRCDRYEIVASLGTSGAAELYLARPKTSGEPCVLKIMAAPGADKQRLRFAQEGVVLAKIAHASVVRVFGAGALGDRVWLAIERFGDHTLGDLLQSGGAPSPASRREPGCPMSIFSFQRPADSPRNLAQGERLM